MTATITDIDTLRAQINERLIAIYPTGPGLLTEPVAYIAAGQGKRLRPLLTLLTARACGGSSEVALPAAVAVELLHNFTLVHDDIMDRDQTRHNQPSVHAKWNQSVAILAGDVLFVLALQELRRSATNVDAMSAAFVAGALAVCEGQALDLSFEERSDVSLQDYLGMVDLKTGHMLGLSAELGVLAAEGQEAIVTSVRRFGRLIGRAFQIQDDLLEIFSDAGTMGKSLGSDLAAGKQTYLLIAARERQPEETQEALAAAGDDLERGLSLLRDILESSGIRGEAEELVRRTIAEALAALPALGADQTELASFAELVLNRKK